MILEAFRKEIRAKYDLKERAFAANDPAPILNQFYSAEVISTDPEGHTHIGRDALRPIYDEVITGNPSAALLTVMPVGTGLTSM